MAEDIEGKGKGLSNIVIVNKLLRETFGRRVGGNYKYRRPQLLGIDGEYVVDPLRLKTIIKKSFFRRDIVIGHFSEEDGSHLILDRRGYASKAKKYARLYEESFGREVILEHNGERF